MNVLIGCEFSGRVREAFRKRGHDAISCDLLDSEIPSEYHHKGDIRELITGSIKWDLMIVFPPCTYLTKANAGRWKQFPKEQAEALEFVRLLLNAPIPYIALENSVGKISTAIRKPNQIINPYQFGHPEKKMTCLWLKNLPKLIPTNVIPKELRKEHVNNEYRDANRWKHRARTFTGIAEAMAEQWGNVKTLDLPNLQVKNS